MVEEIFQNTQDIDFIKINTEPNGLFPNHDPNPLIEANCRQLKELILKEKLDFGFIFDGDADRCCFLDSQGNGIHPYMVYLILLRSLPKGSCVVKSILISPLLELDNEIEVHESKVGHSHMKNVMRKHKAVFGAEHSAHYYYSDFFFSDSGLLTATKIITAIVESGINDIMHQFKYHSLPLKLPETNYALAANKIDELGKKLLELYPDAELSHIDGLSLIDKHKKFWLNIRASNTESNCVRVNIEAFEQLKAQKISDQLNGLIEKL
jgi:phosphomannomutase